MLHSKGRVQNSEAMKEELFKQMAIDPHFAVEEVEKHISLMFVPFDQPLGLQLQHRSRLNDPLLIKVPPYTIPNILVYCPIRIWHKPFHISYLSVSYTILWDVFCQYLPQVGIADFANLGFEFLHQVVELLPSFLNLRNDLFCLLVPSASLVKHINFHSPLCHDLDELCLMVTKLFQCMSTWMAEEVLTIPSPLFAGRASQTEESRHARISSS